ncbi:hypothetical protein M406DRAFT_287106 [Cryphonectria parasitica EP155]|uniref:PH domain-containing protein n=1 Tax=Cryphonectria parasitica (strain ATCC 38755 / EP155) TaxID=660469 RepID=A0A9P4Y9U8_CRYP1|nr:uncharacterized protein M406DRAFT_287106 [Cryphonectria parasitica EP155]KAF3769049.1 hypothetical protein M406DRAFT_287106 [Cryphonectria parasitica EP155]
MSQAVVNMLAKKVLSDAAQKNINAKDPFFEEVKVNDRHGNAKVKKQKKGIPPGVSQHDAKILMSVRKRAYWLDLSLFNLCGIRFGWSAVIGLFPGVGDIIDAIMAYLFVYRKAILVEGGLPGALQSRMLLNIAMDFGIGLVPFLGDVADAWFKANTRNAWLLEEYLIKKAEAERRGGGNIERGVEQMLDGPAPARTKPGRHGAGEDMEMGVINNGR